MGRKCTVCTSTAVLRIDKALLGGCTLMEIVRQYGVTLGSLSRHRSKCLGMPSHAAHAAAPSRAAALEALLPSREEVAGGFASIRSQLDDLVIAAREKGQLSVSIAALDGLRKTWADTARLAGHDRPIEQNINVNVNTGPSITIVVDRLLQVVNDLPEVRARLAQTLLALAPADQLPVDQLPAADTSNGAAKPPDDMPKLVRQAAPILGTPL